MLAPGLPPTKAVEASRFVTSTPSEGKGERRPRIHSVGMQRVIFTPGTQILQSKDEAERREKKCSDVSQSKVSHYGTGNLFKNILTHLSAPVFLPELRFVAFFTRVNGLSARKSSQKR